MPRHSRIYISGALHHIVTQRRRIFDDEEDRHDFIKRLALILEETKTEC